MSVFSAVDYFWGPIMAREVVGVARAKRTYFLRVAFVILISLPLAQHLYRLNQSVSTNEERARLSAEVGRDACHSIFDMQLGFLCLAAPIAFADSLTGERFRKSMEVFRTAPIPFDEFARSMFFSRLFTLFLLQAASMPALFLCLLLGGVDADVIIVRQLFTAFLVMMVASISFSMSAIARTASGSIVSSYMIIGAFVYCYFAEIVTLDERNVIGCLVTYILFLVGVVAILIKGANDSLAPGSPKWQIPSNAPRRLPSLHLEFRGNLANMALSAFCVYGVYLVTSDLISFDSVTVWKWGSLVAMGITLSLAILYSPGGSLTDRVHGEGDALLTTQFSGADCESFDGLRFWRRNELLLAALAAFLVFGLFTKPSEACAVFISTLYIYRVASLLSWSGRLQCVSPFAIQIGVGSFFAVILFSPLAPIWHGYAFPAGVVMMLSLKAFVSLNAWWTKVAFAAVSYVVASQSITVMCCKLLDRSDWQPHLLTPLSLFMVVKSEWNLFSPGWLGFMIQSPFSIFMPQREIHPQFFWMYPPTESAVIETYGGVGSMLTPVIHYYIVRAWLVVSFDRLVGRPWRIKGAWT